MAAAFGELEPTLEGTVSGIAGLAAGVEGLAGAVPVGARVSLLLPGAAVPAEVVGVGNGGARVLPFASLAGLAPGTRVSAPLGAAPATLPVSEGWLGRIVDPLGRPVDGLGPLPACAALRRVHADPPAAATRARLGARCALGVRALDLFTTCRAGQRLGLFAGSGVGKSTLMASLARNAACDVAVIALIGERGREVREFVEDDLGAAGLARSVVVVATSDQPALMRREAAYAAMSVAEHFRDAGLNVLLMMDSVTRFCLALREIGLAAGEPPATRGYPPSVWAELPRLLERAGPGPGAPEGAPPPGAVTALFTVLVEGDDHNEPVADAVRGILDGHVVLDRRIAERGRFPAMDVLRSLSRTVPGCLAPEEAALVRQARAVLSLAAEMADLVRLGAYRAGTDPAVDEALALAPGIEDVIRQPRDGPADADIADSFAALAAAFHPIHPESSHAV